MSFADWVKFGLDQATKYISPEAIAAEWILSFLCMAVIAAIGGWLRLAPLAQSFRTLAEHKRVAVGVSFALPVILRLALLGVSPIPDPSIHDEFSHLLLADTLVHGRLANAAHPLWKHFESIHVLQQPHYASMYPPVQGGFLALGQAVFGHPWAGVLLSVGAMCAAICWMLQGWLPARWALFGTLIAILKICLTGLWVNSYLGGAGSAIGAALVLGAAGRRRHGLVFGAGLVILMNSRPFEGAFLGCAALVYLFFQRALTRRFIVPGVVVLGLGIGFVGYYNFRVTGSASKLPYVLNRDTYGWPENLGFLPAKKLAPLGNQPMENMRQRELANRNIYRDAKSFFENLNTKAMESWIYFLGPLLTIPLLFAWGTTAFPLICFLAVLLGLNLFQMVLYPYHLGPAVPLLFALVTIGVAQLYGKVKNWYATRALALLCVLPCALVAVDALKEFSPELHLPLTYWENARELHMEARADVVKWLNMRPGKHLIVVRYRPDHNPSQEWVYNGADIDGSKIVWARDLGDNSDLVKYFHDRSLWVLNADEYQPRIVPLLQNDQSTLAKPVFAR